MPRSAYLESFNGILGVFLLPDTDDGVGDQNEQNDKWFDESGDTLLLVIFEKGQDEWNTGSEEQNSDEQVWVFVILKCSIFQIKK